MLSISSLVWRVYQRAIVCICQYPCWADGADSMTSVLVASGALTGDDNEFDEGLKLVPIGWDSIDNDGLLSGKSLTEK